MTKKAMTDEELQLEMEIAEAEVAVEKYKDERKASWRKVIGQGLLRGLATGVDTIINTPENAYKISQMEDAHDPKNLPDIEPTPTRFANFLSKRGLLQEDIGTTTKAQDIIGAAAEGAGASLTFGGIGGGVRQSAANIGSAAIGSGTGKAVEQVTGSPVAGMAASVAVPSGAGMLPSTARKEIEIANKVRNETLKEADSVGFITVPDNKLTRFADRPELIAQANKVNQFIVNRIARDSLGLPDDVPLKFETLDKYRAAEYQAGYVPLLSFGKVTVDGQYYQDLINVGDIFKGPNASFPAAVPEAVDKLIDTYLHKVPGYNMDSKDIVTAMKNLRFDASKNISSDDPEKRSIGMAQKAIAVAMEDRLVRHATQSGINPKIIERFQEARKNISKAHVIQEALNDSNGNVSLAKLGKAQQAGDYLTDDLEIAGKFGNLGNTKDDLFHNKSKEGQDRYFAHGLAASAGTAAATHYGMDPGYALAIGALGWSAGGKLKDMVAYPVGKLFGSGSGMVDPAQAGLQSKMAIPSALGYFDSIDREQQ